MRSENFIERSAGILLHPTSLPGKYGMGDMGPNAYKWVDTLLAAKQNCWQILPLGPTGYGDSPYQSFSAFAGNPYLISPDLLIEEGLLTKEEAKPPEFPKTRVDYGPVIKYKLKILKRAWKAFKSDKAKHLQDDFKIFCDQEAEWLDDYSLFMSLKSEYGEKSWLEWKDDAVRLRKNEAMQRAR